MTMLAALLLAASVASASPVVVELFTSQGCSSCPDADALLSDWGMKEYKAGRVIPLSFNVDYWNYLGWRDLFSTPEWTARQQRYAEALKTRTYTPMMVVAGRVAFVGSDGARARAEVARFTAEKPHAQISLKKLPSGELEVTVKPLDASRDGWHVMLAVFENGLETQVKAGENAGRVMRNDFVVRRLVDLGVISIGNIFRSKAKSPPKNVHAIAFLQQPGDLTIMETSDSTASSSQGS